EPKTSTLQIVRCFGWAAAILGMKVPPLYLAVDWTGTLELVPVVPPATRIGRQALADLGARELAFMVGCHLCWFRKEHVLGRMAGSLHRLEDVFLAALMVGNPGLPVTAEVKQRIEPLARSIMPLLEPPVVETLRDCFTRFVEQGGRTNLSQWRRAMERTALRTGMLLANDLSAARTILGLEDAAACEGRMDELIAFFTGERCSLLRKRIGIAVREG
ncbi:MAG: hypothetical protein HY744_02910, partial [Deltaproteobacteria bacterium]|nr:hypothetical protein [Deltaproteobacteria bacterium]